MKEEKPKTPFQKNLARLFVERKQSTLASRGKACTREEFAALIGATLGSFRSWMNGGGEPSLSAL